MIQDLAIVETVQVMLLEWILDLGGRVCMRRHSGMGFVLVLLISYTWKLCGFVVNTESDILAMMPAFGFAGHVLRVEASLLIVLFPSWPHCSR